MKILSLLDYLAAKVNSRYVSDLHYLDQIQRRDLAREIVKLLPLDFSIHEWNDALNYIAHASPAATPDEARDCLLAYLRPH